MCAAIGQPELAEDPRFADHATLMANGSEAAAILRQAFAEHTLDEWRQKLESFAGQWAPVQHSLEVAVDPQTVANGYLQDCETSDGIPFQMVAAPVQFDEQPARPRRSPEFNEQGDDILGELGARKEGRVLTGAEMVDFYAGLVKQYPIISLEDGLDCDYMTGEQPYKLRLATNTVPLYRVSATAERMAEIGAGRGESVIAA